MDQNELRNEQNRVPEPEAMDEANNKLPIILNGKYFKIIDRTNKCNVVAECLNCKKTYKGTLYSTSNFLLHLKKVHPLVFNEYEVYKKMNAPPTKKRKLNQNVIGENISQKNINVYYKESSQDIANQLICKYIIEDGRPLRTVETRAFRNLVYGLSALPKQVTCITRTTLTKKIDDEYMKEMLKIKREINKVPYVCTTADIWSSYRRSFIGVTTHWINNNLERKSYAIACRRFLGTHNYANIAKLLNDIHDEFDLNNKKIVMTITDNGSNFVKAFKTFQYTNWEIDMELERDNEDEAENLLHFKNIHAVLKGYNSNKDKNETLNSEQEVSENIDIDSDESDNSITLNEVNNAISPLKYDYELPKHQRCASHTLSLLGTTDVEKAAKLYKSFGKAYHSTLVKCSTLWNKVNRSSSKANEKYQQITGRAPKPPVVTRWNSKYDAINELINMKDKLAEICKELDIPSFNEKDIIFLNEYSLCLKHIAISLDFLQGESNVFFGDLIPYIYAIDYNFGQIKEDSLEYCKNLATYLKDCLKRRFAYLFNLEESNYYIREFIIATSTHPKWKLNWAPVEKHDFIKKLLISTATTMKQIELGGRKNSNTECESQTREEKENFFGFMNCSLESTNVETNSSIIEFEIIKYLLETSTSMNLLHKYPIVKELFIRYNTALPSSAPVERLFSFAGIILSPRRSNLTDEHFEKCTLLKANASFDKN